MSLVRFFILDAFDRHGEMHGYALMKRAETERVDEWTDISVGSIYGALKRAAAEGLLDPIRSERAGRRPRRQVYAISDLGRSALATLRQRAGLEVQVQADPFDLALARSDDRARSDIAETVDARLTTLRHLLGEREQLAEEVRPLLTFAEMHALEHRTYLLKAEIAWHEHLRACVPQVQEHALTEARQAKEHEKRMDQHAQ